MPTFTQQDGIELFAAAGFEAKPNEDGKTFSLLRGGIKKAGYSNIDWLSDQKFIVREIQGFAFNKGAKAGAENTRKAMREALGLK